MAYGYDIAPFSYDYHPPARLRVLKGVSILIL